MFHLGAFPNLENSSTKFTITSSNIGRLRTAPGSPNLFLHLLHQSSEFYLRLQFFCFFRTDFLLFKGGGFFWEVKWTFWTKKAWAVCNCRMTTKVGAFDRKSSREHFHILSYVHTTSRKVSTSLWSPDSDFLTLQKTWKSAWSIHILHSFVRIPYWKSNGSTWTSQARRNFSRRCMTIW